MTAKEKGKERSTWSWVFEFADVRRRDYVASIVLAVCKVICIVAPYLVLAEVVRELFAGNCDLAFYARDLTIMAVLWVASALFHAGVSALILLAGLLVLDGSVVARITGGAGLTAADIQLRRA